MRKRFGKAGVLLLCLGLALGGCKEKTPPSTPTPTASPPQTTTQPAWPANTLVVVNGRIVSREEYTEVKTTVLNYYGRIYAQFGLDLQQFLSGARGRLFLLDIEVAALESVIGRALVQDEAERRNLVPTEEELNAEFARQYAQFLEAQGLDEPTLGVLLQLQGSTLEAFKASARKQVAEGLVYDRVARAVAGPLNLTEADLLAFFQENLERYATAEQVEASHILVSTEEEARRILAELKAGADFATLARAHSQDPGSAARGGALGWFGRGQMVPEFEQAAFALPVGELSDVVKTQYGYHIILVTNRREAHTPVFAEVADQVRADAENKLVQERFQAWLEETKAAAQLVVLDPLLEAAYIKTQDLDRGLALLEKLAREGKTDEKYLAFILGAAYEEKMGELQAQREKLLAEPDAPTRTAQLAELAQQMATYRNLAMESYRAALAQVGEDADIRLRLEGLEAPASP